MNTEEKEFFDLSCDRVFKAVILDSKDYRFLTLLLRDIMEDDTLEIKSVTVYEIPVTSVEEKVKIVDIVAELKNNKVINVELNTSFGKAVKERNIFYYYGLLNRNIKRGKEGKKPKYDEIIQINLNLISEDKYDKEEIRIYNLAREEVYYENFKIININVVYYKKLWYDKIIKEGIKEHIYVVALASKKEELKALSKLDRLVKEVADKVFELNDDDNERMKIEQERDARLIYENSMKYSKEEGIEEGKELGKQEGESNAKLTIAKKLIDTNADKKYILDITGISEKEYEKIKQSEK